MTVNDYLSISEFAQLSGISRKNLIYYHNLGILSPSIIKGNGYRYYTYPQLDAVSVIIALKEIGVPLKEIKEYLDHKSPELLVALFEREQKTIGQKINRLNQIKDLMTKRLSDIRAIPKNSIGNFSIQTLPEEKILVGHDFVIDLNDMYSGFGDFSDYCYSNDIIYGYPLGIRISYDYIKGKKTKDYKMNYFYTITSDLPNVNVEIKPAGKYVVGYSNSYLTDKYDVFLKAFDYIKTNHLTICGDCYIENILDEICVSNEEAYLSKIFILVK